MTTDDQIPAKGRSRNFIEAIGRVLGFCVFLVGAVVIALIAFDLLAGAAVGLPKLWQAPATAAAGGDHRASLPVYRNVPEDRKFAMDSAKLRFEPYIHWRRTPFASRYVNIDANGLRKTVKSPAPDAEKVFVFGGSTAWGTGASDAYTIPSLLQQRLGPRYDVYNFGETAYVTAQEFNLLLRELAFGNVPDIVIFYDGFNDTYAGAYSPAIPRDPQNERDRQKNQKRPLYEQVFRRTNTFALFDRMRETYEQKSGRESPWDRGVAPRMPENARKTVDVYEQFVVQARAVASAYGFKVFFFWQPHLLTGTRNAQPYEKEIVEKYSPVQLEAMRLVYREAKGRLSGRDKENVFFIGNILDDVDEPIYIDHAHVGPRGNEIVAETMFKSLRGRL